MSAPYEILELAVREKNSYEFMERVAIVMESCGYTEAEAIAAARRQGRESESRRMIKDRNAR